jgi:hypothetical protein
MALALTAAGSLVVAVAFMLVATRITLPSRGGWRIVVVDGLL